MHSGQSFLPRSRAPLRDDLFGQPFAIGRDAWQRLGPAMRREGVMLLAERGLTAGQIATLLDEPEGEIRSVLENPEPPFRRSGEIATGEQETQ